jgi:hypothetical protein
MPATSFRRSVYLTTLPALLELKRVWLVAVGAMIMRLDHLGLVSPRQKRRLWQSYSPWRLGEPLDDMLPLETPSTLREAFEIITTEVGMLPDQVAAELAFNERDIQAIGSLPLGFMRPSGVRIRVRQRPGDATAVLPFKGKSR